MPESFWKIPSNLPTGTPLQLLKQQAAKLTEETHFNLVGEVSNVAVGNDLLITMSIRVPNLNDYVVEILTYRQPLNVFPGNLRLELSNQRVDVEDFDQFAEIVRNYLSSPPMSRVIGSLLAQASA